jgi:DNA-binding SARP family transcriptional activator
LTGAAEPGEHFGHRGTTRARDGHRVPEEVPAVDAAPAARVTLLDGFTLRLGGRVPQADVDDVPRGIQRLIAHLSLAGKPARTSVAGSLWPDVTEQHAQGSLRSTLWRLHQIAPGLVACSGGSLALARGVDVDVRELDSWAHRIADSGVDIADVRVPEVAVRGELLPGWYDDWVLLERERLRQLRMHSLEVVASRFCSAGRHGEALQAAYAVVRMEPLRESAHRILLRIHLAEGNVVEAVRSYERFQSLLARELGVGPSSQMVDLVRGLCTTAPRPAS